MLAVTRLKDGDQYTYIHSVAVATLMMGLARHLGLGKEDIRVAGMAGLLHDIGKMQVAPAIVDKAGKLTINELAEMRQHPAGVTTYWWGSRISIRASSMSAAIITKRWTAPAIPTD